MPKTPAKTTATETPRAAEAFERYLAMGPKRSIRALAERDAAQNLYKNATAAHRVYADWSVKYRWRTRLAEAASVRTERLLGEAAELDADTFRLTSEKLHERMGMMTPALHLDAIVKLRESVRKPAQKGAGTVAVSVSVSVEIRRLAEQVAADAGLDPDAVVAEAERIFAGMGG